MTRETFLAFVLPFVVAVTLAAVFSFVMIRRVVGGGGRAVSSGRDGLPFRRPWWASPWLWGGVSVASLVLGVFVWPGLIGGTFVFLPFVWIGRGRRSVPIDPRANGHGRLDDARRLG